MLQNTFIHIQSIGAITEQKLWESGLRDWNKFSGDISIPLSGSRKYYLDMGIAESLEQFQRCNPSYFSKLLPANQSWRLFSEFKESTVYLDIETTGLDRYFDTITTIASYDGRSIKTYVQGDNLNDFVEDIYKYKVIVSYNGKSFDVPFLEQYFNIKLNHAHIDLRYVLASLGFRGGLKRCETALGTDRGPLEGMDGYLAVWLWDDYRRNHNPRALETLLAYNMEDVVNLEQLMVIAYNMKIGETPFLESHRIPRPPAPEIPFRVDPDTVQRVRRELFSAGAYGDF